MDIAAFLQDIRPLHASGQSTEHSYRPALERLFRSIDPDITVINEPQQLTDVGAPDFVFRKGDISIGWCEAKDIGKDIRKFGKSDYSHEQKQRYIKALPNLIYTNGLDFEFIRDGEVLDYISIADHAPGLPARPENFAALQTRLADFVRQIPISISSAEKLAEMMAGKAALIKHVMGAALLKDKKAGVESDLIGQYEAFKRNLLPNIDMAEFTDIYAETIAYGLFAARLHDTSQHSFTRAEALELLPKSNPFLRKLFQYIAGYDLDERLIRVVDELCEIFRATDLADILKNFGKFTAQTDPFLHFYETFLKAYNPKKKKSRGVWYTPEPVVNFIVRAVDEVLKAEFGLAEGLADTSKITIDWDSGQTDNKGKAITTRKEVHRVQILDPATGTGTFLAEAIRQIAERVQGVAPGQWSAYVERDLVPRIHGFELLMASYAMCHMKLDMMLRETGYSPSGNAPRLGVYLTNSLEEGERVEQNLFAQWLANEAKAANEIKRQTPIMCIIGNPPYSGISQNMGPWISGLIEDYKYVDGEHFGERKHWLHDDYVKFIRFSEHMIAKNGEGVLGFITNHGYLDNPTFRGMRWHLLNTFDAIYVLDLHGNSKKKEIAPDGRADKNVFDIQQGVAIMIAVKKRRTGKAEDKPLARVFNGDLWGAREGKYAALWQGKPAGLMTEELPNQAPNYPFIPRDYKAKGQYDKGFAVTELMQVNVSGIVTARDALVIDFEAQELTKKLSDLLTLRKVMQKSGKNSSTANHLGNILLETQEDGNWVRPESCCEIPDWRNDIRKIAYRPLDTRYILYREDMVDWGRENIMQHLLQRNLCLMIDKITKDESGGLITEYLAAHKAFTGYDITYNFPLYLYPEEGSLDQSIRLNMEPRLYAQIRAAAGFAGPVPEPAPQAGVDFRAASGAERPEEVQIFDYIYGVLHCPAYRETYAEFLKIDFPRIPFPHDAASFAEISTAGEQLRRLHLMEEAAIGDAPYPFLGEPPEGEQASQVDKPVYRDGKVWINTGQYFDNVPEVAWEFPIGGYQPAQKWLKDRKGRALEFADIRHYQRIIKILVETDRIMRTITIPGLE